MKSHEIDMVKLKKLTKLAVNDDLVDQMKADVESILGFYDIVDAYINSLDASGHLEPLFNVNDLKGSLANIRKDQELLDKSCTKEEVLSNSPELLDDFIVVPKVIE